MHEPETEILHSANLPKAFRERLSELDRARIPARIWEADPTVWSPSGDGIDDRLGWLHAPDRMTSQIESLRRFAAQAAADGFRRAILLGMGGSSLAPETLSRTFSARPGALSLTVLDSTHPDAVRAVDRELDPAHTLFIVATKSGTTAETISLFRWFFRRARDRFGSDTGRRFVAITDPGSPLIDVAARLGFRETFLNDPHVGGRYSALTLFGLVPAALLGIDLGTLLGRARAAARACGPSVRAPGSPAACLGTALGLLAERGRDKATFVVPPAVRTFADWAEQLLAESTGKAGRGILPIIDEPLGPPAAYGPDRVFIDLRLGGEGGDDERLGALEAAGAPILRLDMSDHFSLGAQFFIWEMATAVAGHVLRVNPFDQPDVESAKTRTREMIDVFRASGGLPEAGFHRISADRLRSFLADAQPPEYAAVHAYLPPGPAIDRALHALRTAIRDRTAVATTVGYGPRFLHSTGQFHKGGGSRGRFIQLIPDRMEPLPIPDCADHDASTIGFETLIVAQALGDRQALLDRGRAVISLRIAGDPAKAISAVASELAFER